MNVVILAAGKGKRMHSDLPKVLHPLAGKALLAHVIETSRQLGAARICVVYGHGGEQVRETLDAPDLGWARQEPQLGTGHAVLQAMPALAGTTASTLVLYGDVPLTRVASLQRLIAAAGDDALGLLTAHLNNPHGYGRIVRVDGKVVRIVEEKDADDAERAITEINTGILVAPTAALARWLPTLGNRNAQGEYYLTDIVAMAVSEGMPVATAHPEASWETEGVNSKLQLAQLERVYQQNLAVRLMEQGVTLADPSRIDVRGELICGRDVSIDVNCVFEGRVVLGDGVRIKANCVLEDAVVGAGSVIGPFARLRPGPELGRDVHVGNFVEVKNSSVADHSKANHLAYIGDATIGSRVNVGAGTITCNYDGANKFRTVIEDDAFIGSDTQLVAPVTVGRGATLGAGTTLTRNAPRDQLTISRAQQVSIPGWKRATKNANAKKKD
ncbi:MAG: bifunctional UDP-N-acetylglucosamine diphosphorylase/glucosamine-1-phosphate N-acetyltransferase GlmU [Sterolibacteriaceae bacterium]|nr:bifunctional UDP-N-acetylglucosamine diphosphorylase/glucosamine-1-phosphate N-acetyltransferase GlmU [Sterolibacteriaceae bacterium]